MKCDLTIPQILSEACHRYGDKTAFSGLGQALSYADLNRLSDDFASYLQHHTGLQPGDRIALQLPNLIQYPVLVHGALKAGMIVVNTNPLYTARELHHQFNDAGVKLVVVASMMVGGVTEVVANTNIETVVVTSPLELGPSLSQAGVVIPAPEEPVNIGVETLSLLRALELGSKNSAQPTAQSADDIAMLQYTGGTTGVSKGAMLSHSNITSNARQVTTHLADIFRDGLEVTLCPLPLYHIYAFTVHCMASVSRGGHNVLVANPRDLDALVREIQSAPLTGLVGLNTLFNALLHHEGFKQCDLSALRSTSSGGHGVDQ